MMGTSHSDGVSQAAGEQSKPTVLFVCVHNAGKSQMAAAIMRQFGGGLLDVRSAGTDPDAQVHDLSAVAVAELGADMSDQVPIRLEPGMLTAAARNINDQHHLRDLLSDQEAILELLNDGILVLDPRSDDPRVAALGAGCAAGAVCRRPGLRRRRRQGRGRRRVGGLVRSRQRFA